ncbi:hypothetical protein [Gracilimonas tropica]|uniref:hypothetical protein n=1 Tax=Gracilimonas tropica TaxID=454600 RepID=UPI000371AE98|nr:hypothetical protein [Gracilimonas tropica]
MIQPNIVEGLLRYVNKAMRLAEYYDELMEAFDIKKSDPVEYLNYYHRIDRIWKELDERRELGEGNDEILEAWERVHIKACEIYQQLNPI